MMAFIKKKTIAETTKATSTLGFNFLSKLKNQFKLPMTLSDAH